MRIAPDMTDFLLRKSTLKEYLSFIALLLSGKMADSSGGA